MLCEVEITFTDLVLRAADKDGDGRTIEGMIAPWDRPTPVMKPVPGMESFKRGAFDRTLNEAQKPIPLLLHHNEGDPAGKLVAHDNREDGHYATFRLFNTRAGDDALELVREGMLLGLSVGGWGVPARTEERKLVGGRRHIIRSEMRLDHVGLVRVPAYEDARVMALRAEDLAEFDAAAAAKARQRIRQRMRVLA